MGHEKEVERLLQAGADVNAKDHSAAQMRKVAIEGSVGEARMLLEASVNHTARDIEGMTALHLAEGM